MEEERCRCGKGKKKYSPLCDDCTIAMGEFVRDKHQKPLITVYDRDDNRDRNKRRRQ